MSDLRELSPILKNFGSADLSVPAPDNTRSDDEDALAALGGSASVPLLRGTLCSMHLLPSVKIVIIVEIEKNTKALIFRSKPIAVLMGGKSMVMGLDAAQRIRVMVVLKMAGLYLSMVGCFIHQTLLYAKMKLGLGEVSGTTKELW